MQRNRELIFCLVLFIIDHSFCFTDKEPIRIVVHEGHQTDLPCQTENPSFNKTINVQKVLWFHQRIGRPLSPAAFYTIDLTGSNQVLRWSNEKWQSRAYFSLMSYPFSLKLIRLEHADAGTYICQVQFKDGTVRNGTIQLQVVVPPMPPRIYLESGEEVEGSVGPLNETTKLVLVCKVKGGKPSPSVSWKRVDGEVPDGNVRTTRSGDVTTSVLTIPSLRRDHHNAAFACESASDEVTYHSNSVRLDLNLSPLLVQIRRGDLPLSSGYHAEIVCEVWGSVPPARVTWWKNGINLEQDFEHTSMDGNLTTSVVRFQPKAEDNGQSLVCRAENPRMSVLGVREDQWNLNVHYRPRVQISLEGARPVSEKSDVTFVCTVDANPPPYGAVVWRHNGHKIPPSSVSPSRMTAKRNRLTLHGVSHLDQGNYTCEVSNSQGLGAAEPFVLRIKHYPICRPHQRVVYSARVGETIYVSCSVIAHPSSVSFRWKVNASRSDARVDRFTWDGTKSIAEFTPRDTGDFGVLQCWARSQVGDQKDPCTFVIVDSGSPWGDELTIAASLCVLLGIVMLVIIVVIIRNRKRDNHYIQEACGSGRHGIIAPKNQACNNNQCIINGDAAYLT